MAGFVDVSVKEKPVSKEYEEKWGSGLSVGEFIMSSTITARKPEDNGTGNTTTEETSSCCGSASKAEATASCCCSNSKDASCSITVLGSCCDNGLLEASKNAVENMGLSMEVKSVTDMEQIRKYGVVNTPALLINGQVVSMGKLLNAADVEKLLHRYGG